MNLLRVKNLSIHAPEKCLLQAISFEINQKERLVILGQTGAGKSLIAQAIMGNLSPQLSLSGELNLFDQVIKDDVLQRRLWGRQMSLLPQEPWDSLDPLMPVQHQLASTYRLVAKHTAQGAKEQAHQRLQALGLGYSGKQRVHELSGGMAQRVALACAMAGGASLLLADEPTKGLDTSRRNQVVQELLSQTEGGALLLITHDIDVARQVDGRVLVIKDGHLVEEGSSHTIFQQAKHHYTRTLIAADPQQWETIEPSSNKETTHTTSSPVLSIEQLAIGRNNRPLLNDLSLTVQSGEVIGIVGDSGCGKSTLGDTLLGLIPALSGTITRHNQTAPYRWQKLYQDPTSAVTHSVSLHTLLHDLVKHYGIKPGDVTQLMKRLDLNDTLLQRSASNVSGGELQRFCLLRALLLKPVFLFADEPTSRLDPITAKEISALLVEVAKETHCAVMLVSHDHHMIQKRCDKVLTLSTDYS
ncbi:MAG: ABC transporter ATP-binding protein [Cellvibrionaceae bacterium]